ncbi:MAG: outer membrane beta-barrel protein [Candidatus Binataceae bacterium]
MLALLIASTGWAAGPAAAPTSASEQQRLDALSGQVSNLAAKVDDTQSEVKKIEKEIVVAAPADANAKPQTVGEHVGLLEKNFGDFKTNVEQNLGVSIHGLVDAGYEHNFNQPVGNVNPIRVFDQDGFQLTQGNLHIEKDGTVGFVTDLNFGQVANTLSAGTHYSNAAPVGGQFFDPTQYYLTYTAPVGSGISLQAGRFVTLLGEETINTYNNLNYNESKGIIFGFGIPFTHTGVRGSYTFNDYVSATAGLNNGWDDPAANNNGGPSGEGELSLNNKDKSLVLLINGTIGSQAVHKSNSTLGAIDLVPTWKPAFIPNLTLAGELLYASEDGPVANGHSASWDALSGYVVYDWNQYEFATRAEVFDDKDGARTTPNFNSKTVAQTLWEITQTVSYKVPEVTGLLVRLEYRHDNSNAPYFTNNNFVDPVTSEQHLWHGQDTMSTAVIYAF